MSDNALDIDSMPLIAAETAITCPNGHKIATVKGDIHKALTADDLDFTPGNDGSTGQPIKPCAECGHEYWRFFMTPNRGYQFHTEHGWLP